MIGMSENVISIAEWKAKHQRITDQPNPVVWTYYEVVRDPSGGWRLELVDRKPKLELD
jgi:hypothetical protein